MLGITPKKSVQKRRSLAFKTIFYENGIIKEKGENFMFKREKKYYVELTSREYHILIHSLVWWRNKLIEEGYYADAVNELLIKLAKCK